MTKYTNNLIETLINNYRNENQLLFDKIENLVNQKWNNGYWDKGINDIDLTSMLLYEYSTSIQKLTNNQITADEVISNIEEKLSRLRFRNFKNGIDDVITYNKTSVTSEKYTIDNRLNGSFGALNTAFVENNNLVSAIALFDNTQQLNGQTLSGIDLSDLSDIRSTFYHEITHLMERIEINSNNLSIDDLIFKDNNSTYINFYLSPDLTIDEYQEYINNPQKILELDKVPFAGISTIEINKNCKRRIMHNQISEGATELISRLVLNSVGDAPVEKDRYAEKVDAILNLFKEIGLSNSITYYFKKPHFLIKSLENLNNMDVLHTISRKTDFWNLAASRLMGEFSDEELSTINRNDKRDIFNFLQENKNNLSIEGQNLFDTCLNTLNKTNSNDNNEIKK